MSIFSSTMPALEAIEEDRWRAGWDTKVFNYINLSREYFRRMRARGGVIVNLTGIGGDLLDPSYIAGGVGNAAMAAFTKSLGSNSHQVGVRVVGINQGRAQLNASSVWHARKRRSGTAIPIAGRKHSGHSRSAARRRRTK